MMTPAEHFMRHEAECKFMAQLARDAASKAVWIGMAERWRRCAELAKQQSAMQARQPRRRKAAKTWSH
jgi:hypothetical protein